MKTWFFICFLLICAANFSSRGAVDPPASPVAGKRRMFPRRADFLNRHLFYTLQQCTNLVSGLWVPAESLTETVGGSGGPVEWVTNQVQTSDSRNLFFRLRVGLE